MDKFNDSLGGFVTWFIRWGATHVDYLGYELPDKAHHKEYNWFVFRVFILQE